MNLNNRSKGVILALSLTITSTILNTQQVNANSIDNVSVQVNQYSKSNLLGIVKPCDYLNVRSGASTKYSVIDKLYTNETVTILGNNQNGWIKIQTKNNTQGWVNGNYITQKNGVGLVNPADKGEIKTESDKKINDIIYVANKQMGKQYKWGASGPNAFDCSGFTYYSYKNGANISLPRSSREQAKAGIKVDKNNLKAGDLVFFNTSGAGISHVGIYIGKSQFIHASTREHKVRIDKIDTGYYNSKFVTARRIVK